MIVEQVRTITPMPWSNRAGILTGAYLRRLNRWKQARRPRSELRRRLDVQLERALTEGDG